MKQYMTSVYSMTTLNYDHVMACVLKHFPYRRDGIDPYEFSCKVLYAVMWLVRSGRYYFSLSFLHNQIHLLTDDRHQRIANFLKIAEQTGVIEIKDGKIFKDQSRFITPSDFHTIRIDNPLLVAANEVEPVGRVENVIKKITQKSAENIERLIKKRLLFKIKKEYRQDYEEFFIEGESKDKSVGEPLF